jgi:hypothetical protein
MDLDMETRLRTLEGQVKVWRRLTLTGLVAGAALLCMGQASVPPSELTTRKLTVVNDQGQPRAILCSQGDAVYLVMGDALNPPFIMQNGLPRGRVGLSAKDNGMAESYVLGAKGDIGSITECQPNGAMKRQNGLEEMHYKGYY